MPGNRTRPAAALPHLDRERALAHDRVAARIRKTRSTSDSQAPPPRRDDKTA